MKKNNLFDIRIKFEDQPIIDTTTNKKNMKRIFKDILKKFE